MRLYKVMVAAALLLLLPFAPVSANEDAGPDLPYFSRLPNYYVADSVQREFDEYAFLTPEGKVRIEGKKYQVEYYLKDGKTPASPLQITRNYSNAAVSRGGVVIISGGSADSDDGRSGITTLTLKNGAKELWLDIWVWNDGEGYTITMIEKESMQQQVKADILLNELNANGHAPVYINFDFGKATIPGDQRAMIDEIYNLLAANPGLNLQIEGHTDNIGDAAGNKRLSEQRARSVVNLLVQKGINSSRLSAAGYGMDKPVADNASEEGRAKNRRVELVKK